MGKGSYTSELFSLSGILKICESILILITLIVHRHGDRGEYVFFGTASLGLGPTDDGVDIENLGNGILVTYAIITPVLLLGYVFDGRYVIQSLFLEPFWNFLGFCCFLATGIQTIIVWHTARKNDDSVGMDDYATKYAPGLALGSMCLIISIFYFIDFCVSYSARSRIKSEVY